MCLLLLDVRRLSEGVDFLEVSVIIIIVKGTRCPEGSLYSVQWCDNGRLLK